MACLSAARESMRYKTARNRRFGTIAAETSASRQPVPLCCSGEARPIRLRSGERWPFLGLFRLTVRCAREVDDAAAPQITPPFFAAMHAGTSPAQALRQAKLAMLAPRRRASAIRSLGLRASSSATETANHRAPRGVGFPAICGPSRG